MRVTYQEMYNEFVRVLQKYGMTKERAELSAKLFADASLEGIYTHGLNRFPKFIESVENGSVSINAEPVLKDEIGFIERYDGQRGPGNLNAYFCMERAIQKAKKNAVGITAISNTNHWMRPGAYVLMAAEKNCIGILWTNTLPNMPAWGGKDVKLGNNPVVICIPYEKGHVLIDIAMSMFSYGKLESYMRQGKDLPVDGGFDRDGNITRNAAKILETHRPLPIGFWKGSGLSLSLDLIASIISGGRSTCQIGKLPYETGLSQVFAAINLSSFPDQDRIKATIAETLEDLHNSEPVDKGCVVRYPGEGRLRTLEENLRLGIPVDEDIWNKVIAL
jgi:3-dehydro-L-gulonate 2-dehydrogenase